MSDYDPPDWMEQRATKIEGAGGLAKYEISKEAEATLKHISSIKPKIWKEIGITIDKAIELNDSGVITSMADQITSTVELQIENFLSPLKNEIDQIIATAMSPILEDLSVIINELTAFIGEGAEGALIGGLAGSVAALFLPGGVILTAIGAIVGALIQKMFSQTVDERRREMDEARESLKGTWLEDAAEAWTAWGKDVGGRWEDFWRNIGWK